MSSAAIEHTGDLKLIAYEIHAATNMPIEPATGGRSWMDETPNRFAYRCLPMVLANQAGWIIPSPTRFTVRWNGGPRTQDLRIWFGKGVRERRVVSHFGGGILTITIPYLFRTPPGINLWVKGPSNWTKDGIQPLEGIVETDWSVATFTMNWKLTRADYSVRFKQGEPICMIVPVPRTLVETLQPCLAPIAENKQVEAAYQHWQQSRIDFNKALENMDERAVQQGWQKDYLLGRDPRGQEFRPHQTRLHIKKFVREISDE